MAFLPQWPLCESAVKFAAFIDVLKNQLVFLCRHISIVPYQISNWVTIDGSRVSEVTLGQVTWWIVMSSVLGWIFDTALGFQGVG